MIEVFRISFMQQALLASLIVGVVCAFLGVYVVLKRIVFVGVALAQLSSAGVATALLFGASPMLFSFAFMLAGVAAFSVRTQERHVPRESLIGVAYATATALGILLVAKSARGESHMLGLLFGNILAVTTTDVYVLAGVCAIVMLVNYLFAKEFLLSSFDPETAQTLGVRARLWDLLFYLALGVVIAVSIRIAGALLVFAFLVIPAVTALLLARRLKTALALAAALSVVPVVAGLYLSFVWDLPSAATIVLLMFVLVCLALPVAAARRM